MRRLDLSGNNLNFLPKDMDQMKKLEELNLSFNLLWAMNKYEDIIVNTLGAIPKLKSLNLSKNKLVSFNSSTYKPEAHFVMLEKINLSNNEI